MKTEQWSILMSWFAKNRKTLPPDVAQAIDTLLDERNDDDEDEE